MCAEPIAALPTRGAKSDRVFDEVADASKGTIEALKMLGDEIRNGYNKIRKSL